MIAEVLTFLVSSVNHSSKGVLSSIEVDLTALGIGFEQGHSGGLLIRRELPPTGIPSPIAIRAGTAKGS